MSRPAKLGLLALGLLVLAVVVNSALGFSIQDILRGYEKTPMEGGSAKGPMAGAIDVLPQPKGPENAPVKMDVWINLGHECPTPLLLAVSEVFNKYPTVLRVEYRNSLDPALKQQLATSKISCENAVTINGKNKFEIPGPNGPEVIYFQGLPHARPEAGAMGSGQPMPGGGPPANAEAGAGPPIPHGGYGFTPKDLAAAVEQELVAAKIDPAKVRVETATNLEAEAPPMSDAAVQPPG
jgi:hypothetical protein